MSDLSTSEKLPAEARVIGEAGAGTNELAVLGYQEELKRNRTWLTILSQSLVISSIPYGIGGPLLTAFYGGGQLPLFIGWLVVSILAQCLAISLAELNSRFPTSAGPYYWTYQLSPPSTRVALSFLSGWVWLIANWIVCLSAQFGMASFTCSIVALYYPEWVAEPYQVVLICWAFLILSLAISMFCNKWLPALDAAMAVGIAATILIVCISLSVKAEAGRNSARTTLVGFDNTLSGWGNFGFFIGLLPSAWTFSAIGMVSSMAEEVNDCTTELPKAMVWMVPVSFVAGLFYIIPICATLPALENLLDAPYGQALPYMFVQVLGSTGFAAALSILVAILLFGACITMTTAASRCTWALARDEALPGSFIFKKINPYTNNPLNAALLAFTVEALLCLIYLGNASAFNAFVSVAVFGLAVAYIIPIIISVSHGRREVNGANWNVGNTLGLGFNIVAIAWVAFELVLFSMPTTIPTTPEFMNYAIVVFTGFLTISAVWYVVHARKVYKGPPESDGIGAPVH